MAAAPKAIMWTTSRTATASTRSRTAILIRDNGPTGVSNRATARLGSLRPRKNAGLSTRRGKWQPLRRRLCGPQAARPRRLHAHGRQFLFGTMVQRVFQTGRPQGLDRYDQGRMRVCQLGEENGSRSEGDYVDHKPHGHGVYTLTDGNSYSGQWSNGCFKQGDRKAW